MSEDQKGTAYCQHIPPAREAAKEKRFANSVHVNVENLVRKLADEEVEELLEQNSTEGDIEVFVLPGEKSFGLLGLSNDSSLCLEVAAGHWPG